MHKINCPNCASTYDANLNKCPCCGTSYYDLSALDFASKEPFYLKIKTKINNITCYITQLVRPVDIHIDFSEESQEAYDTEGNPVCCFGINTTITTDLSFETVVSPAHNNLFTIEIGG